MMDKPSPPGILLWTPQPDFPNFVSCSLRKYQRDRRVQRYPTRASEHGRFMIVPPAVPSVGHAEQFDSSRSGDLCGADRFIIGVRRDRRHDPYRRGGEHSSHRGLRGSDYRLQLGNPRAGCGSTMKTGSANMLAAVPAAYSDLRIESVGMRR
jgi:hypothetical protein